LAHQGGEDILGRSLSPDYRNGFLQWTTQAGSHELIARTEVRPRGLKDTFGFNCFGCCPENSFGDLVPGGVNFDIGVVPAFEACEYITTCNGVLGPFPATVTSLTYGTPLSWNGFNISSAGLTYQVVSFRAEGEKTDVVHCVQNPKTISDNGDVTVDKCQKDNAPGIDPTKSCAVQKPACADCYDCCEKNRMAAHCRCDKLPAISRPACKAGADVATQSCRDNCLTTVCL
jgi:hypothetical protein